MESFLKVLLDTIWRIAIIGLPVIGYAIEQNNDSSSLVFGIMCFISAALIGEYGKNYKKLKTDD